MPITSVLVIPGFQGSTPSDCFALASVLFVVVAATRYRASYFRGLACAATIFVGLAAAGQLIIALGGLHGLAGLDLVRHEETAIIFRSTLFTQSLYLLAVVCTFFFVRYYYTPRWVPYILAGGVVLGAYGIYELLFYALTGRPGDFVSNRSFSEDPTFGSLFQTLDLAGITMQRLKSLTGEPSMYALTILPYWVFALHTGHRKTGYFLFATLVLTTSTTAFLGFVVYTLAASYFKRSAKPLLITAASVTVAAALSWTFVRVWVQTMLIDKLALENESGLARFSSFTSNMGYWWQSSWLVKIFGVGFGTVRSADLFSTLLVNDGALGFVLVTLIFLYPLFRLKSTSFEIGLKQISLVCFVVLMISVPEFSYLSTWLFLGIAYKYSVDPATGALPVTIAEGNPTLE